MFLDGGGSDFDRTINFFVTMNVNQNRFLVQFISLRFDT